MNIREAGVAAVIAVGAVSVLAAPARTDSALSRPRTLVSSREFVWGFAQDGTRIAWGSSDCKVHSRRLGAVRRAWTLRLPRKACAEAWRLALAGRAMAWENEPNDIGRDEAAVKIWTTNAGARRIQRVEALHLYLDDDEHVNPYPSVVGAGKLLLYSGDGIHRIVRGRRHLILGGGGEFLGTTAAQAARIETRLYPGNGCHCASTPAWSPDDRGIMCLSASGDYSAELAVMNADGSAREVLTHDGLNRSSLDWSADGAKVAYSYFEPTRGGSIIAVANPDGSDAKDVGNGSEPAWSPDRSMIAFRRDQGIFVMNADGSGVRQLTGGRLEWPAWSPDGLRIAYSDLDTGAIVVMASDGNGKHPIHVSTEGIDRRPDWSPDGRRIAFDRSGIWVVDADGGGLRHLTNGPDENPRWSPDGSRILVASGRNNFRSDDWSATELFLMTADGGDVRPLTFTEWARWVSPGEVFTGAGKIVSSFEAGGKPYGVAVGGKLVVVLTTEGMTLFDSKTGAKRTVVQVPRDPQGFGSELAGISGRWVVCRTGRTIRLVDSQTLAASVLAVAPVFPIGLSVSGRRVAWAENLRARSRIRALTLPR